jgi:hypothetical protein
VGAQNEVRNKNDDDDDVWNKSTNFLMAMIMIAIDDEIEMM